VIKGIDLSHHNGEVNWGKLSTGFVYLKATEGEGFTDHKFADNWAGAQSRTIPVGAYHFFDPAQDAGIQAEHFCKVLDSVKGKRLPPVLDIEKTGGVAQALILTKVRKWLDIVEKHTGQKPMIYTGSAFAKQIRLGKAFKDHPLWIAHYRVEKPPISGWTAWTIWQYNDQGKVAGVPGHVDMNWYNGTLAELRKLCR
jgi:lysozyme